MRFGGARTAGGTLLLLAIVYARTTRMVEVQIGLLPVTLISLVSTLLLGAALGVAGTRYVLSREGLSIRDGGSGRHSWIRIDEIDSVGERGYDVSYGFLRVPSLTLNLTTESGGRHVLYLNGDEACAFGRQVARGAADAMWPDALAEWARGGAVGFAAAQLDQTTLSTDGWTLSLVDIERVRVASAALYFRCRGDLLSERKIELHRVTEPTLFVRLLEHAIRRVNASADIVALAG